MVGSNRRGPTYSWSENVVFISEYTYDAYLLIFLIPPHQSKPNCNLYESFTTWRSTATKMPLLARVLRFWPHSLHYSCTLCIVFPFFFGHQANMNRHRQHMLLCSCWDWKQFGEGLENLLRIINDVSVEYSVTLSDISAQAPLNNQAIAWQKSFCFLDMVAGQIVWSW